MPHQSCLHGWLDQAWAKGFPEHSFLELPLQDGSSFVAHGPGDTGACHTILEICLGQMAEPSVGHRVLGHDMMGPPQQDGWGWSEHRLGVCQGMLY